MRELSYLYATELQFSGEVREHTFTMKVIPASSGIQKIESQTVGISPPSDFTAGIDGFGNKTITGVCREAHTDFRVISRGIVRTGISAFDREEAPEKIGLFKYPSTLTRPGDAIRKLALTLLPMENENPRAAAERCMSYLYANFSYRKGVTWVGTTAESAIEAGSGVCQDFAHIFLSVMRLRHIPARYCVGMMMGEGESHAWGEICEDGKWYGYDPTNGCLTDDRYIRISVGRDAADTRVSLGLFRGFVNQTQTVRVSVHDLAGT